MFGHHVLPHGARAGDHDAEGVRGWGDLGTRVTSLAAELERERGWGRAAAHDGCHSLGVRVVAQRERVAADAGARGLAHVQRRRDRDGGIEGVAAGSQDAEARFRG